MTERGRVPRSAPTLALALGVALAIGCGGVRRDAPRTAAPAPPAGLLGSFVDDYGGAHAITPELWVQSPRNSYHVMRWDPAGQYLIAVNDSANASAPGRWTRIDWMELRDMAPYTWAFCLSAYDAATEAEAEATTVAERATPRTGCNGYPFSRMRRR